MRAATVVLASRAILDKCAHADVQCTVSSYAPSRRQAVVAKSMPPSMGRKRWCRVYDRPYAENLEGNHRSHARVATSSMYRSVGTTRWEVAVAYAGRCGKVD
jgi:hypothetical protein